MSEISNNMYRLPYTCFTNVVFFIGIVFQEVPLIIRREWQGGCWLWKQRYAIAAQGNPETPRKNEIMQKYKTYLRIIMPACLFDSFCHKKAYHIQFDIFTKSHAVIFSWRWSLYNWCDPWGSRVVKQVLWVDYAFTTPAYFPLWWNPN